MPEETRSPSNRNLGLTVTRYAALFLALLGLYPLQRVLTLNVAWDSRLTFLTAWIGMAVLPLVPRLGGALALTGLLVHIGFEGQRIDLPESLAGLVGLLALVQGWRERRERNPPKAVDARSPLPRFGLPRVFGVIAVVCAASYVNAMWEQAQRGQRLESHMMRRLGAIRSRCPPGLTPVQWVNCVGSTTTMVANASLNSADKEELVDLKRRFEERMEVPPDLELLDWLWDEVPPVSRRSMVNWKLRPNLYRGAGLLVDATRLAASPADTKRIFLLDASDAAFAQLSRFPELQRLWIDPMFSDDSELAGDASLVHLQHLVSLKRLELRCLPLTGAGFVHWQQLIALEVLDLTGCSVDDPGFRCLPPFPNLRVLILHRTRVSTLGNDLAQRFPRLRVLGLRETRVTSEDQRRLLEAQPNLIVW